MEKHYTGCHQAEENTKQIQTHTRSSYMHVLSVSLHLYLTVLVSHLFMHLFLCPLRVNSELLAHLESLVLL